ncbi:hypothetical protein SADUNF_Sadunf16G0052100 [Salix dunnii]|uniref:RecA family profile 2 domain-containing protein n=1 Tax=Salix dunnii TaxID=1413687 RepID=A0A835J8I9_9ROSI|nr:hypothetical protein SADUNF_Sadunf16G0052100 [Salix dunnii]
MVLSIQSHRFNSFARFRFSSLLPSLSQNGRDAIIITGRNDRSLSSMVSDLGLINDFKNDFLLVGEVSDFEPDELHDDGEAQQKDNAIRLALTHLAGEFVRESIGSVDVIVVDTVRKSLKSGHAEEVTHGGNALKFYSAVLLRMNRTRLLKTKDKITGLGVCAQVVKNKLAPAMTKAEHEIQFGRCFCTEFEVLELACESTVSSRKKETASHWQKGVWQCTMNST